MSLCFQLKCLGFCNACCLILTFMFDKNNLELFLLVLSLRFCAAVGILLDFNNPVPHKRFPFAELLYYTVHA